MKWLRGLWILLYISSLVLLAYFEYHLSPEILGWSLGFIVLYIIVLLLTLGFDHVVPGVFLSYLFTGIIGDVLLLRIHGELIGDSWIYYLLAGLSTGIVLAFSTAELLEPGRLKPVMTRSFIVLYSFASIVLSIYLFRLVAPSMLGISLAPLLIIGLSIILYALLIFYDQTLFQLLVKHIGGSRSRPDTDKYLYTQVLSFFLFTLTIIVILIPNFKPSERPYLALSILYSYLYSGLSLSLIASLFLGHSFVTYQLTRSPGISGYLSTSVKEYVRLRYVSSLINLFKHIETSPRGRKIMSVEVVEALRKGYEGLPRYARLIRVFRKIRDLLAYLERVRVLEARPDTLNMIRQIDPSGYLAKTFETIVLRAYRMKITGDERYTKELKQLKSYIRSYKAKTSGADREKIIELLEKLREPNVLDELVSVSKPSLRHLRNRLVHGRLSRELIMIGDRLVDDLEFLDDPLSMYVLCSCLLIYTRMVLGQD